MPRYKIHTTNATFEAEDEGTDYPDQAAGFRAMVYAAGEVALDEINRGRTSVAVEARLIAENGKTVERRALTIAVAELMLD